MLSPLLIILCTSILKYVSIANNKRLFGAENRKGKAEKNKVLAEQSSFFMKYFCRKKQMINNMSNILKKQKLNISLLSRK